MADATRLASIDRSPAVSTARGLTAPERLLIVAGLAMAACFLVATLRIPLPRWFPDAGVSLGFPQIMSKSWQRNAIEYTGLVVVTFAIYGVALGRAIRHRPAMRMWVLLGLPALCCAALLLMYPPTAADVFHYHADARTFWVFDRNPLTVPPATTGYAIGISWAELPSPYGPLWSLLTAPAVLPAGDHWLAGLVGLKLIASISLIGCAWLLFRLVRRIRPGWEVVTVVLLAWNPYVLLRVAGNGHNDLVMMFFVLLAMERAERRDWLSAFPALTAGVLVKYIPALLGPPLLLYALWHLPGNPRRRLRALLPAAAASLALLVLVYMPFWAGSATFDTVLGQGSRRMITSLPMLVQFRLQYVAGLSNSEATDLANRLTSGLFLLLYLPLAWQARRDMPRLLAASALILFFYLTIAASWYRPWYTLWPLTLMAALSGSWYVVLFVMLSFSTSFPDLVEQYRYHWDWLTADAWRSFSVPVVVQNWPPMLVWWMGLLMWKSWFFDLTSKPVAEARVER